MGAARAHREAMQLLRDYFTEPQRRATRPTGAPAPTRGSSTRRCRAVLAEPGAHPATTSGEGRRLPRRPVLVRRQRGRPGRDFFPGLWDLLRENDIPFRLHWGKFQPVYARGDRDWVDFFRAQYPRWDDFLALRAERDPNNIFLTDYWRDSVRPGESRDRACGGDRRRRSDRA